MFLPTKNGIICDYCGMSYTDEFVYYSCRTIECQIINNIPTQAKNLNFNSDMCESCYKLLLDDVKKHIGNNKKNTIKCDLSNECKSGTFVYYIMYFDKVYVNKDANEKVKVENNVMDLNIINGMDKLMGRVKTINEKAKMQGGWS